MSALSGKFCIIKVVVGLEILSSLRNNGVREFLGILWLIY